MDGFKAGADDYVAKPFHVEELLARLQAVVRRSVTKQGAGLSLHGLSLEEDHQAVRLHTGECLQLTGMEFRLLRYFMLNAGKVLSKARLTEHVYEYDEDRDSNVIEVCVNRLRGKLGKDLIRTMRGHGYVFGKSAE